MFDYITSQSRYIYIVQLNIQYEVLLQLQLRSSLERAKIHSVVSLQYIKRCLAIAQRTVAYVGYAQGTLQRSVLGRLGGTYQGLTRKCCLVYVVWCSSRTVIHSVGHRCSGCACLHWAPPLKLAYPVLAQPPPPLHTARTPTASLLRTKTVILTRNTQRILLRRPTPIGKRGAFQTVTDIHGFNLDTYYNTHKSIGLNYFLSPGSSVQTKICK